MSALGVSVDARERVVRHWRLQAMSAAWNSWQADAAHGRLLLRAVGSLRSHGVSRALLSWAGFAAARSRSMEHLRAASAHLSSSGRECRWALERWHATVGRRSVLLAGVTAWSSGSLRRSLLSWLVYQEQQSSALLVVRRALQMARHDGQRVAFWTWADACQKGRSARALRVSLLSGAVGRLRAR